MKNKGMLKIEKNIINFIEKHLYLIVGIILVLLSFAVRYTLLSYESSDYILFLKPWFNQLKLGGGLAAISNYTGDYNMPYVTILALLTYIKVNPLISIKIVSIIFDYILAFLVGKIVYDINGKNKDSKNYALIAFCIMLFAPTVLLNSSFWSQCDVIYTTFIVLSFYLLHKNKYTLSFIALGLAFAFKLQFIFVIPAYLIFYFREKKFSILNFLIIPIVNFILCIPAMIAGKSIFYCLTVYFRQTSTYNSLNLNFPNFYSLVTGSETYLSKIGIVFVILIFALMFTYIVKKKIKIDIEKFLLLIIWSVLICTFFLPYMHERYMFVADILSILYVLLYKKNYIVAIIINMISLISYTMFLFCNYNVPSYIISILFFMIIVYITKMLIKEEKIKSRKDS